MYDPDTRVASRKASWGSLRPACDAGDAHWGSSDQLTEPFRSQSVADTLVGAVVTTSEGPCRADNTAIFYLLYHYEVHLIIKHNATCRPVLILVRS